jgi:hypothetical protein
VSLCTATHPTLYQQVHEENRHTPLFLRRRCDRMLGEARLMQQDAIINRRVPDGGEPFVAGEGGRQRSARALVMPLSVQNVTFTGLAQNLGHLEESVRGFNFFHSDCWVILRSSGSASRCVGGDRIVVLRRLASRARRSLRDAPVARLRALPHHVREVPDQPHPAVHHRRRWHD